MLSLLLWVFVSFSKEYFTTLNVPVQYRGIPKGYVVTSNVDNISITVKGQGWALGQITFGRSLKFVINVRKAKGKLEVKPKNFVETNNWLSSNLQIIEISPSKYFVNIVEAYGKNVKVVPRFEYSLNENFALCSEVKISPSTVKIWGPKKQILKIKSVNTEQVKYSNIEKSFTAKLPLEKIPFVNVKPPFVNVNFKVDKLVDKTFRNVKVEVKGVPRQQSLVVIPSKIDVTLRGALKLLANYRDSSITVFVSFAQALRDTVGTIEPKVIAPPLTEVLTKQPERLKYIIKKY